MMGMHTTHSTLQSTLRRRGAVALIALALTFAISPAAAQQWTPKQRAACEPDAMRLCNQYVPDIQRTSACMSHYRRYLSPACRAVFYGGQRKKLRRHHGSRRLI
jgi:type II secretory pathway component PulL